MSKISWSTLSAFAFVSCRLRRLVLNTAASKSAERMLSSLLVPSNGPRGAKSDYQDPNQHQIWQNEANQV